MSPRSAGASEPLALDALLEALTAALGRGKLLEGRAPPAELEQEIALASAEVASAAHRLRSALALLQEPEPPRERAHDRPSVVVVDDHAVSRRTLCELLAPSFEVREAGSASEAVELFAASRPDVVVSDLHMPGGGGLGLLAVLREQEEGAAPPLIVLSADSSPAAKVNAFQAGAFDYVTKPVDADELAARIRNAVARSEDLARARQRESVDDLTGLGSRRRLRAFLEPTVRIASHAQQPLAVVMLDMDGLKAINDRFGHATGDEALRRLAAALRATTRDGDCASRFGGDEFVLALPGCSRESARRLMERFEAVLAREALARGGESVPVAASWGVAVLGEAGWDELPEALLERADRALYERKRARNTLRAV